MRRVLGPDRLVFDPQATRRVHRIISSNGTRRRQGSSRKALAKGREQGPAELSSSSYHPVTGRGAPCDSRSGLAHSVRQMSLTSWGRESERLKGDLLQRAHVAATP